ncbi:glucan biosynthesis protein [Aestuariivirga sp.]|uniref:glucan biosynthesis protein n=1 Tax=Aestuariivirga sp. TaxID=2650926 RepID=UPI0039E60419
MTTTFSRRHLLLSALAGGLSAGISGSAIATTPPGLKLGEAQAFSFDTLVAQAKDLAAKPFVQAPVRAADRLQDIDFDAYQQIAYKPEDTLWEGEAYPVRLFHLGRYFKQPVRIYMVEGGQAREVIYDPDLFTYGPKAKPIASKLPPDLGFAGFRVMNRQGPIDWLAFLGASYFRSSGELAQYGMSVRGIAIDTAMPVAEEFPRFTTFHLEEQENSLVIHALLEGPSITGAFRIDASNPKQVLMDVQCRLFARTDIARLGVAPLTSMFWYSEVNQRNGSDWRPQIHDSEGLALWTGVGERIWRPLNDPPRVMTNSFLDTNPKGFGLLQRDRDFTHYQDDGVFYDRRPSVWVEPKGTWGEGEVQLVEIPTDDEVQDNIAVYWVPRNPVRAGDSFAFDYRLHWTALEPFPVRAGHVVATRRGRGGLPGVRDEREKNAKYVIDFDGGDLASRTQTKNPAVPAITASRGEIINPYALPIVGTTMWRMFFDLKADGDAPVDLRAFLRSKDGEALTETWLWQHFPEQMQKS